MLKNKNAYHGLWTVVSDKILKVGFVIANTKNGRRRKSKWKKTEYFINFILCIVSIMTVSGSPISKSIDKFLRMCERKPCISQKMSFMCSGTLYFTPFESWVGWSCRDGLEFVFLGLDLAYFKLDYVILIFWNNHRFLIKRGTLQIDSYKIVSWTKKRR